jgi:hypothetical protein
MTTYLAIMITLLILTQIVRVIQNTISLRMNDEVHIRNERIYYIYLKIEKAIDKYLNESEG